jgi:XTP/dITP diphosphohydrolase
LDSEILLATRSLDKSAEILEVLTAVTHNLRFVTLNDLEIAAGPGEDRVEEHETFIDNAIAKARYFALLTGRTALADDSGLMVDALGGLPGVRTKRFAADHGITTSDTDAANNDLLLTKLVDVPSERRGAQYVCAAAIVTADGAVVTAIGACAGVVGHTPAGSGGFGYDPLFILPELNVTFAQLTRSQKHDYSHRARAFRSLAPHLK